MPNETNWQDITRRLDINSASVTTDSPLHKERAKGRAIKKIGTQFVVPSYVVLNVTDYPPEIWPARIVAQYNFTNSTSFKMLNAGTFATDTTLTRFARLAIRWRAGEVGYRYALTNLKQVETVGSTTYGSPASCDPLPNVPAYTNQIIGAEFCIEVWTHRFYGLVGATGGIPIGLLKDITIQTNRLALPTNSDELYQTFTLQQTLHDSIADNMAQDAVSETLPVDYAAGGAWNSN